MSKEEDKRKGTGRNKEYDNKDTNISRSGESKGKYADEGRGRREDVMGRRDPRQGSGRGNRRRGREDDKYNKQREEDKVRGLRDRRKSVQKHMDTAKNSENPLEDIDWGDKNLKSKDRRKLKEEIARRNLDNAKKRDVSKKETEGLKDRIDDNKKDLRKESAKKVGKAASVVGTGGLSAILAVPSLMMGSFKKRKLKKDSKKTKRQIYVKRIMFALPTMLVMGGFMFMSFFIFMEVANITSIALSHPEGIKELHKAGVLGDALNSGNVTEDVVVDGEVIVKGNPDAQPGCFEWNGVWYCGGCLTTGGDTQGATASNNSGSGVQGTGETIGTMGLPLKYPFKTTSDTGFRGLDGGAAPHGGMDLVALNDLDIIAADGGKVVKVVNKYAPDSGYYKHPGGWGNYVIIEHESENYRKTLYGHLNTVDVKEGDVVSQGQKLGIMGHTGSSTARHLHFEVWSGDKGSSRTEPRDYLKLPPEGVTWSKDGG